MNNNSVYDIIIGAGPSGLTAALFAHSKDLKVLIVEGLEAGGQLRHLYPYKPVYNFPGYSVINGGELAESMIRQVRDKAIPLI